MVSLDVAPWGSSPTPGELSDAVELLLAAAGEFHGAISVADALRLDLTELASDLKIMRTLESYRIRDLTDIRILHSAIDAVRDLRASMPERKIAILERYLFARDRVTLETLGQAFGVSRERTRQIKNRVAEELEECVGPEIEIIATTARRRAGPLLDQADLKLLVDDLFSGKSLDDPAVDLTRRIVEAALEYDCVRGVCASESAREVLGEFKGHVRELADDVGLIDEDAIRAVLPDERWHGLLRLMTKRCGLAWVSDRLALRLTKKARAKAAILAIGRLATLDEIAAESGLPRVQLGGLLSNISGIVRASKTKWGISEWVDDEYEGIAAEIMQRVEEDGGTTTLARLLSELPRKFEVKETSVRTLVATPQFVVHDGNVRLAEESEVVLRDIYDVVDGVTEEGWPYWTFRVEDRYFEGYSLSGVPPEIADALGCPRNGSIKAVVSRPTGCRRVSVNWRLTSVSGASVGYISSALGRLGVAEGDRVSLVVVEAGVLEFRRQVAGATDEGSKTRRLVGRGAERTRADKRDLGSSALLERLKQRRRVL